MTAGGTLPACCQPSEHNRLKADVRAFLRLETIGFADEDGRSVNFADRRAVMVLKRCHRCTSALAAHFRKRKR